MLKETKCTSQYRVGYPMMRVDFSTGTRNAQNRGKSGFVRTTWDEALNLIASELTRVKETYGASAGTRR